MGDRTPRAAILGLSLAIGAVVGCGGKEQPVVFSVSGTVTYHDGSPVEASQMELKLIPSPELREAKDLPMEFAARVNTREGTWAQVDGLPAGEYEVEVVRHGTEENPSGFEPLVYRGEKIRPAKVVVNPGKVAFEITIPKQR